MEHPAAKATLPLPHPTEVASRVEPGRAILVGIGDCLPRRIVTNDELATRVDTSDAWIRERTGIRQRRIAEGPEETCTAMAIRAAQAALADATAHGCPVTGSEVDAVLVATTTPDQAFPSTATRVQAAVGAGGFAFDLTAACSGFIYALSMAEALILVGKARCVLVIGSEVYSRILNWQDRTTCVLFGDGAGAVLLRAGSGVGAGARGVLSTHLHSDGRLGDALYVDGAVGRPDRPGTLVMNGREVFRHAVTHLSEAVNEALATHGLTAADIDWLVPHQANARIIDGVARRLGLPPEKVMMTVDRHANTSAASIPLALAEGWREGRIRPGQLVLMEALGGGLTWGSALVRL